MAGELKSAVFRKEREETWRELDRLISRIEKKGLRQLTPRETLQLPLLYRQTLSSLSVARATSLDAGMLAYLEALAARAYLAIYGVNRVRGLEVDYAKMGMIAAGGSLLYVVAKHLFGDEEEKLGNADWLMARAGEAFTDEAADDAEADEA